MLYLVWMFRFAVFRSYWYAFLYSNTCCKIGCDVSILSSMVRLVCISLLDHMWYTWFGCAHFTMFSRDWYAFVYLTMKVYLVLDVSTSPCIVEIVMHCLLDNVQCSWFGCVHFHHVQQLLVCISLLYYVWYSSFGCVHFTMYIRQGYAFLQLTMYGILGLDTSSYLVRYLYAFRFMTSMAKLVCQVHHVV